MSETIFVQIAAYRDLELVPTVRDAIAQAAHPDRLSFGICWQYGDETERAYVAPLTTLPRFRLTLNRATHALGVGWARRQAQALWNGERYTLQIDAHTRFAPNWDDQLIEMLSLCPSARPILSGYPKGYLPPRSLLGETPEALVLNSFTSAGICIIAGFGDLSHDQRPRSGTFVGACFLFADSALIHEVPHDPKIVFLGEETLLSVRAWTRGWDIYHPHRTVVWHNWDRIQGRISSVWSDCSEWEALENRSHQRVRQILGMEPSSEDFGIYGIGAIRSLAQYERMAGIDFKRRRWHFPALDLLRFCARSQLLPEAINRIHELLQESIQPYDFVRLARRHNVAPLAYHGLNLACKGYVHTPLRQQLRVCFYANALRMQHAVQRIPEIVQTLEAGGTKALPFGGPMLAASHHGDPSLRQFEFIDILISEDDYYEGKRLLVDQGFESDLVRQSQAHGRFMSRNIEEQRDAVAVLTRVSDRTIVRLIKYNPHGELKLDFIECWRRRQPVTINGVNVDTLHHEDCLAYLAAALTDSWGERLGWICEIAEWARVSDELGWHSMVERADAVGATSGFFTGISVANSLLGVSLPPFVRAAMPADEIQMAQSARILHQFTGGWE